VRPSLSGQYVKMDKPRVLIVEDAGLIADRLRRRLQALGYQITAVVSSGTEAVQAAVQMHPDVVLMDIELSGEMDGVEAATQIHARCDIPVVYLTAHADGSVMQRAKVSGPSGYIVKPFKDRDLYSSIEIALHKHEQERKLRESEARYHAIVEDQVGLVGRFTPDGRTTFANESLCRFVGKTRGEVIGSSYLSSISEKDRQIVLERIASISPDNPTAGGENRIVTASGKEYWIWWSNRGIFDEQGNIIEYQSVGFDITEWKQTEERLQQRNRELAFLNRASRTFNSTLDLDQVLATILEEVRHLMDVVACSIWLVDPVTDELVCQHATGPNSDIVRGWRLAPGEGIAGWSARTGESLIIPDTLADRRYFTGVDQQTGLALRSILSVPLQAKQTVIGVLQAVDAAAGRFGPEDLGLLEPLGASAAIAIENARLYEQARQEIAERRRTEEALEKSEATLRSIFRAAPVGIGLVVDRVMGWTNDTFQKMVKYSGEELAGKSARMLYESDEEFERVGWVKHAEITDHGASTLETRLRRKDGQLFDVLVSSIPIDPTDHSAGTTFTAMDITDRKRAEKERERLLAQIQEQAERVQHIIDTVPDGVILLDTNGRIILANPTGEVNLVTLAGAHVGDILTHLSDRPLRDFLTSPPTELWHEVTAGTRTFNVIARSVSGATETEPTPGGWVLVIHDATPERESQQRIQQQERLAAVGQLAAGIAHDFNNIMAVIVLYAEMSLRLPDLPAQLYERLETISQQARRATELIQQILDFSRRTVLERRPIDLLVFLREQVKMLERTLPESIQVQLTYDENEHTVNADPTRIQQAVLNLAVNARDAMPDGGRLHVGLKQIRIEERRSAPVPEMKTGEWVCVTVSDSGTGIPPDVLPHIFDPFFTTKAPGEGTGLGLSQVYGIVAGHDGHVDVATEVGRGTTFSLYLPALAPRQPQAYALRAENLVRGQGQTIMVVEDNATTRRALVDSLELLNYQVMETTNGKEALALLEQHADQIALVLSDAVMPEMGGKALFQALQERGSNVKMAMLTGHPMDEEMENLRAQGLVGWVSKPPSLEQLAQMVAQAIEEG
jgi:two-component system cell cycle sensor histidine kinase/response regulator CckA